MRLSALLISIAVVRGLRGQVPASYSDLYSALDARLAALDSTVTQRWNGSYSDVVYSAELLSANANQGLPLLRPQQRVSVLTELDRLRARGVQAVTFPTGFPLVYAPFYRFNADPDDYQAMIDFDRQLVADIHARGMRAEVEVGILFPGYYSKDSGFNLSGYYATLSTDALIAVRIQNIVTVARDVRPDFVTVGSEPDTEAELTRNPVFQSPTAWAQMAAAALAQLRSAGVLTLPVGAGIGAWQHDGAAYVRSLCTTDLDFIDLHVYPVNGTFLDHAIAYADMAASCGKRVSMTEAWLLKMRDSELGTGSLAVDPTIYSRDAFSFWSPLDQRFLRAMTRFAHWKKPILVSPFWSKFFWAYLHYEQSSSLSVDQLIAQSTNAAGAGLLAGKITDTGAAYHDILTAPPFRTVSAASLMGASIAPDAIINLSGGGLSSNTEIASRLPLPEILGTASAQITDSVGRSVRGGLYFVSPAQINLWIPPGLQAGPVKLTVSSAGLTSTVELATVAPGIFTANSDGRGVAAGVVTRVAPDGSRTYDVTFECSAPGTCQPRPIDVGGSGGAVAVALFGTDLRNAQQVTATATAGSVTFQVLYAGAQREYPGMDQVNVLIPRSLAGSGEVVVQVVADGAAANPVVLRFQ